MPVDGFRIRLEAAEGYLDARVERLVPYSFAAVLRAIDYVAGEAQRRGATRVLYDTVTGVDAIPDADHYRFIRRFSEVARIDKLAIVSPTAGAATFIADLSANVGYQAQVFATRAGAAAWLTAK